MLAHELAEFAVWQQGHGAATRVARTLTAWEDGREPGDPLDDARPRRVKAGKPPEKVLPRRV